MNTFFLFFSEVVKINTSSYIKKNHNCKSRALINKVTKEAP